MCRIHYIGLEAKDIVFDRDGSVQALADLGIKGHSWNEDIQRLITTYWFHVQMSAKYFGREDFFKLNGVLRILMDTHTSLLLTAYDQTTWGGSLDFIQLPALYTFDLKDCYLSMAHM